MTDNGRLLKEAMQNIDKPRSKPRVPRNQWQMPGEITTINSPRITMQGVSFPVYAQPDFGPGTMMQPGQEYYFPGASSVTEYPQMQSGGILQNDKTNYMYFQRGGQRSKNGWDASDNPEFVRAMQEEYMNRPATKAMIAPQAKKKPAQKKYTEADMAASLDAVMAQQAYGHYGFPFAPAMNPMMTPTEQGLSYTNPGMSFEQGGQMIRRADGSYSKRGLWDNIRANSGSGKAPTSEMLKQERKIRAEEKKYGGGTNNPGFDALPDFVKAKILSNMAYGGTSNPYMQDGGEPNGEMAMGQMAAVADKMSKLLQFVKPAQNLDPWIASKLAVMDHSADAINDYLMYGPDAQEEGDMMMRKGGSTHSGNAWYQDGGQFTSVADYAKASGRGSSFKDRKEMAEQIGITGYRGTAAQNKQLLERLQRSDRMNVVRDSRQEMVNPQTGAMEYMDDSYTESDSLRDLRMQGIRDSYNRLQGSGRTTPRALPNKTKSAAKAVNGDAEREAFLQSIDTPQGGAYPGPSYRQGAGANPYANTEYYDAVLNRIDKDPRSQANIKSRNRQEFFTDLAVGTLAPWAAQSAMGAMAARMAPKLLPASSNAIAKGFEIPAKGLKSPGYPWFAYGGMNKSANFAKGFSNPRPGDEMDVTPEQLQMLQQGGYTFEII